MKLFHHNKHARILGDLLIALFLLILWLPLYACNRADKSVIAMASSIAEDAGNKVAPDRSQSRDELKGQLREILFSRLNLESRAYDGKKIMLVFHRGVSCIQCVSQLSLLGHRVDEFKMLGIEIVGICPTMPSIDIMDKFKSTLHIDFPVVEDKSLDLFYDFNCIDADNQVLHGLFLVDQNGQIVWQFVSEHAVTDIKEILRNCSLH